ncbi:hypothetical protein CTE07_29240 [Chitinophaga terrae (ex Kim and Jung 2007)]|nr:hypothetical protein CTE07_29240 [Chitinophaga terrae (ex Kim and Jung 2007)]
METDKKKGNDTTAFSEQEIYLRSKKHLDSVFNANQETETFSLNLINGAVHIGHLFTPTAKDAVLGYYENDSVLNVIVLRRSFGRWDTLMKERICPARQGALFMDDAYTFSDWNGDGIPDLKVIKDQWEMHTGEISDLWTYQDNRFIKVKGFDKIISAQYDKKTRLIYSYMSTGCADMSMYFGVFKITGSEARPVKQLNCDCCNGDSCTITINGLQPYNVPIGQAYKHVPAYFAEGVKEKCLMK